MFAFDLNTLPEDTREVFSSLLNENAALKKQIEYLSEMALQDELTGLTNRRGFKRSLEKAVAFSKRYKVPACLVFIDLNKFKQINDEHGHAVGDIVLQTVGQRIARQVRSSDLVARLGGDEFVVLFWQVTEEAARARAGLLMHAISRDMITIDKELSLKIKASAGVAVMKAGETADILLERADTAMYQVKSELKLSDKICPGNINH